MGCQQDAFDDDLPGERNRFEMCRRRGVMCDGGINLDSWVLESNRGYTVTL